MRCCSHEKGNWRRERETETAATREIGEAEKIGEAASNLDGDLQGPSVTPAPKLAPAAIGGINDAFNGSFNRQLRN
jgi:hypothetical protein